MVARRFRLLALVFCGLVCGLGAGAGSAVAAPLFGGYGENGEEAGQIGLEGFHGMAVSDATGDVYVSDIANSRVDEFDGAGKFLLAWGWGVSNGTEEPQKCTTTCQKGYEGTGVGELCAPTGVAVDNDPLSLSYEDVYVISQCDHAVEKFSSSGEFLLMFGGHVNATTGGDVCVAGEVCKEGTRGSADGEFQWEAEGSFIGVGPGGAMYIGDKGRIQVFESTGAWREDISLSGLSSTGVVTALAVNQAGDMFVKDQEVPGVREFAPSGMEQGTQFDAGSESVQAVALDEAGDLFVTDTNGGVHFLKYDSAGKEQESFGSRTLTVSLSGMVFSDTLGELLIYGEDANETAFEHEGVGVWAFALPPLGPLVEPGSESATPGQRGVANMQAFINPEGNSTSYHFEYVGEAQYKVNGFADATSTPSVPIGSSFEDQSAQAEPTDLTPGDSYHYRVVATDSSGHTTIGPDQSFQEVPAALVEGPWAEDLAGTSVTLDARIDPLGVSTEYRLEYGTSVSYGQVVTGNVGEGSDYVLVGRHFQDLQPRTVYHYRIVTTNSVGAVESSDRTFTTTAAAGEISLPDERAWELVSPPDKKGASPEPFARGLASTGVGQAAADGSGIAYITSQPVGEDAQGNPSFSQILSKRGPEGWSTEDITTPVSLPKNGEEADILFNYKSGDQLFSPDLSLAVVEPPGAMESFSLSAQAPERTIYLRDNANGTYLPIVNDDNVPVGTKYGKSFSEEMKFVDATPDLSHIVVSSAEALTSDAVPPACGTSGCNIVPQLFEWSKGGLQLVSILPNGKVSTNAKLAVPGGRRAHTISNDGRRIAWTGADGSLYVRGMVEERTWRIGGAAAHFQTMSGDGSRIFFLDDGELYEFDMATDTRTDLTASHGAEEGSAGVQETVIGAGEDGSSLYFVASGVLATGAVSGADNLYYLHATNSGWSTTHIATLSSEDEPDWGSAGQPQRVTSRVSSNGRYLVFMSNRSLAGYDNIDASSGRPDEEVYLYDALSNHLICTSCNPTGARPSGVLGGAGLLVDRDDAWGGSGIAGLVPGWKSEVSLEPPLIQPRYLSDSGRVFFDSPDALVPQDTNGLMDVYEYEPVGLGSCTGESATYSERSDGCVSLISSGQSSGESAFLDASESGDDVFFATSGKLVSEDYDTSYDVYDAHVCSTMAPCSTALVSPPPCTSGDSCKAAPSPQPAIFGLPPSATFSGTGNVTEPSSKAVVRPRSLTRAQKLARALHACKRLGVKKKRVGCEVQARRRYGTKQSHKTKTKKGGR